MGICNGFVTVAFWGCVVSGGCLIVGFVAKGATKTKGKQMDISYERNRAGAWVLTALIANRFITRTYFGYTKKESTQLFRQYVKGN